MYADAAGEETFHNNKTLIYLGASASAEFFADLGLCPLEAVKVKLCASPTASFRASNMSSRC